MNPTSRSTALVPWLLLLPPAVLAWPFGGAPLADDPFPHLAGTGIVALAALPIALLLPVFPASRARGLGLLALLTAFIAVAALIGRPADALEARRTLVLAGTWCVLYTGGSLLQGGSLRRFNRGLLLLSLVWILTAVARSESADGGHLAGILGDTGSLSQAALPGAAVGAWYVATRGGLFFGLGLLAVGGFLGHASVAPVFAGGVALGAVLFASTLFSYWARHRTAVRRRLGLLTALTVFSLIALRGLNVEQVGEEPPSIRTVATGSQAELGGIEVRARIWGRMPAVLGQHLLVGLGPGQFQAGFPPFRDPREIELSRHGVCSELTTEVEHAHDDYLEGLAEFGLFGGALWIVFLLLAARASLHALRGKDFRTIAMGAAALALLVNALFHAPLLFNPAASSIGFVLFGALRAREHPARPGTVGRSALAVVAGAGLLSAILGWPLVAHGRALDAYVQCVRQIDRLQDDGSRPREEVAGELARALQNARQAACRALAAAPASAPARFLVARLAEDDQREAAWAAVLAVRPHSIEALQALGLAHASAGDVAPARALWEEAQRLSPTQPRLLRNLARLELLAGDAARGLDWLQHLRASGCADERWTTELGVDLVLTGRWEAGAPLLSGAQLATLVPEEVYAEANGPGLENEPRRRKALHCLAYLLWGRQQIASGNHETALRSYRQVLAPTRVLVQEGAPAARVELAAAELLAGRADDARQRVEGLAFDERLWAELPAWARSELSAAGLYGGS